MYETHRTHIYTIYTYICMKTYMHIQICKLVIKIIFKLKKLRIWSHLQKKSLMENFIFCAAYFAFSSVSTKD